MGNAWAFLLAWLAVRSAGGTLVLRMEDIDPQRSRPEYARALVEDLRWLGLDWDEGPAVDGIIPDEGDMAAQTSRDALDAVHALLVLLMAAVREVEARGVHSVEDELLDHLVAVDGGSLGTDDLSLSHFFLFLQSPGIIVEKAPGLEAALARILLEEGNE